MNFGRSGCLKKKQKTTTPPRRLQFLQDLKKFITILTLYFFWVSMEYVPLNDFNLYHVQ